MRYNLLNIQSQCEENFTSFFVYINLKVKMMNKDIKFQFVDFLATPYSICPYQKLEKSGLT